MAHHGYTKYREQTAVADCRPCPFARWERCYAQVTDDDGAPVTPHLAPWTLAHFRV